MFAKNLEINGVKLTAREFEIISCLVNAKSTKSISLILNCSPRTIEAHIQNIMGKLGYNSRERIVDWIENSHHSFLLKKCYEGLILNFNFEKTLKKISQEKYEKINNFLIIYCKNLQIKHDLIYKLPNHLNQIHITAKVQEQNGSSFSKNLEQSERPLLLFLEKKEEKNLYSKFTLFLDLSNQDSYYFSVFEIIKKLISNIDISDIIIDFKKNFESITKNSETTFYIFNDPKETERRSNIAESALSISEINVHEYSKISNKENFLNSIKEQKSFLKKFIIQLIYGLGIFCLSKTIF